MNKPLITRLWLIGLVGLAVGLIVEESAWG